MRPIGYVTLAGLALASALMVYVGYRGYEALIQPQPAAPVVAPAAPAAPPPPPAPEVAPEPPAPPAVTPKPKHKRKPVHHRVSVQPPAPAPASVVTIHHPDMCLPWGRIDQETGENLGDC